MYDKNHDRLIDLCKMETNELINYIGNSLCQDYNYTKVIGVKAEDSDFYWIMAEGTLPVALIAHADTVGKDPPAEFQLIDYIMTTDTGKVFDDRAGIFMILELLSLDYRPTIIITNYEEKCGIGATNLINTIPALPYPIHYLIELDCEGNNKATFYNCGNEDFTNYILSFGFTERIGSYSDISIISPQWDIASVNLSAGYMYEHTQKEYLNLRWFENTIEKVSCMLEDSVNTEYFDFQEDYDWMSFFKNCKTCDTYECEGCVIWNSLM